MLRAIFGEPRRIDAGLLQDANRAVTAYCEAIRRFCDEHADACTANDYRLELWASGFSDALNELEQSIYCCGKYAEQIDKREVESLDEQEMDAYRLHLYFYKNAFIRVFSVLDKLGHFTDDMLELETRRIKPKFSYFTVLRRMKESGRHARLEERLFELKMNYRDVMDRLRTKRNFEIHAVNTEMLDDLSRTYRAFNDRKVIEDLPLNITELQSCFEMVCRSMAAVFVYAVDHIGKSSKKEGRKRR